MGPRAVLDVVVKRKIPSLCQELNPRTLIVQPIAQHQKSMEMRIIKVVCAASIMWPKSVYRKNRLACFGIHLFSRVVVHLIPL
jgi:hypothetical protein